jgi:hypothetical protein
MKRKLLGNQRVSRFVSEEEALIAVIESGEKRQLTAS